MPGMRDHFTPPYAKVNDEYEAYQPRPPSFPSVPPFSAQKEFDHFKDKLSYEPDGPHHMRSPACLLQCVKWVLDVSECPIFESQFNDQNAGPNLLMDPNNTKHLITIVSFNFIFANNFFIERTPCAL